MTKIEKVGSVGSTFEVTREGKVEKKGITVNGGTTLLP